jgi:hypothetical protein
VRQAERDDNAGEDGRHTKEDDQRLADGLKARGEQEDDDDDGQEKTLAKAL